MALCQSTQEICSVADSAYLVAYGAVDHIRSGHRHRTLYLRGILNVWLLGISAYYHDSAAVLIGDGHIIAAAQEERFNRQKHYAGFPAQAITYCLQEAEITLTDIEQIVFYEKPFLRFERLLETYLAFAPRGFGSFLQAMPLWIKDKLFQKRLLIDEFKKLDPGFNARDRLLFTEHHLSHAASAFYPSPFERALILIMDGVGEWATTSVMLGEGVTIQPLKELHFPHSLGLLYSAFTTYCGFKVNDGEYKLMGLAPYGEPRYVELIKQRLVTVHEDGSFDLNMRYFDYCTGLRMTNRHFAKLFGREPRLPETEPTQLDMDLACSIQQVTEEIILKLAKALRNEYNIDQLCLAGGVALNCVANGKLLQSGLYDGLWIQPAAGDSGGALGAALAGYHLHHQGSRQVTQGKDAMQGGYLGPAYSDDAICQALDESGLDYQQLDVDTLVTQAAQSLANGKVIGWFQGRMEFGPRALGNRSILGDPRSPQMQSLINQKIKFRESFRPFAPSVLMEDASEYFELDAASPYMLLVAKVKPNHRLANAEGDTSSGLEQLRVSRSDIPAVTHVDYSARIQTVCAETNPLYYQLVQQFKQLTGYGLVVNTSFNVRDEPIVCTPADAIACFKATAMDELYIGAYRVKNTG